MMNSNWILAAASVTGLMLASFSEAQDVIYAPARTIADQKIVVHPWGSGTVAETDDYSPPGEGTESIRITSRNLFQGGLIVLGAPVDLSADYNDKGNCLRLTYRLADTSVQGGIKGGKSGGIAPGGFGAGSGVKGAGSKGGGFPGGAGGVPGGSRFGGPGGGTIPGQGGGSVPGGAGGPGGFPGGKGDGLSSTTPKTLSMLRLVITTTDGLKSEAYVPAAPAPRGDAWPQVAVPLQGINGFGRTNKIIQSIALAGDTLTTFYVGGLKVVNDPTPVTGSILVDGSSAQSLNLAVGDEVTFSATGFAGASVLKYTWAFNTAVSPEPDATGQTVKRKFRKPGQYVITLSITDVFGLKKPYTTTINATVNP